MKNVLMLMFLWYGCLTEFSDEIVITPCQKMQLATTRDYSNSEFIESEDSVISPGQLFPAAIEHEIIISRTGYTISYNCEFNIANWVAYELTADETKSRVKRKNNFKPDPMLDSCNTTPDDYAHSGYDKGHLAPSADMCWSLQTMEESFYMTNMAPQKPRFNRGIWKRLEDQSRDWAVENKSVFIITGPVLENNLTVIGNNGISVPVYFFRVILDFSEPDIKGIAFIMANKRLPGNIKEFAVSIDSVERLTSLDFFYSLPDEVETTIEYSYDIRKWLWNGKTIKPEDEE